MKKTFRINEKRINAKYNKMLLLLNLPSAAVAISLLAISLLFITLGPSDENIPEVIYKCIFYGTYFAVAYSFLVCLAGSLIIDVLIRSHRENTYIEISDSLLIISQHSQIVRREGRIRQYKKLWIINLDEVENVECIRNSIILTCKARYFNEDASWLGYVRTENGVDFDNWWYNDNGGTVVRTVEITDLYTYGARIAQRIAFCADKIKKRNRRREEFRKEMLEIAKNNKHKPGLEDRYKPKKRKRM